MKINWRVRLRNKTWLAAMAALLVSFAYSLLELLGVTPALEQSRVMELVKLRPVKHRWEDSAL